VEHSCFTWISIWQICFLTRHVYCLPLSYSIQEIRDRLRPLVQDTVTYLHNVVTASSSKTIIVEGANATMLDIDFGQCYYSCPVNLFGNIFQVKINVIKNFDIMAKVLAAAWYLTVLKYCQKHEQRASEMSTEQSY